VQVEAFKFKEDQKRALVSRLLQRQCVTAALGIPWEKVRHAAQSQPLCRKGMSNSISCCEHAPRS
jgi:phosphopantetheinyl transferase